MTRCMCGADDCERCFPGNFHRGTYVDEDHSVDQIDDALEDAAVSAYEARQERDFLECEDGRYDP